MTTNDKHCQTSVKSDFYDGQDYSAMYDETIPVVNAREIDSPSSSRSSDEEVVRATMSKFNPPVRHTARHDFDSESESDSEPEKFLNIDSVEDEDLKVAPEMENIFQYIMKYTPQKIDIEFKLQPFVPEYVPGVGDADAFLKVSTPANDLHAHPLAERSMEATLNEVGVPPATLDCSLSDYAALLCGLFDIPKHGDTPADRSVEIIRIIVSWTNPSSSTHYTSAESQSSRLCTLVSLARIVVGCLLWYPCFQNAQKSL
ncbi:Intraflagellar transport protein 46 [Operophtera brumata]|uniref:Intraflagellar transport protein 46 homolog n=1 Tax=Operophtera brumata TaxID=104452 RepID=A0A0L7KYH6_OPEBR|nr:Intraflagellar transport protein 46 [Operophtera brumata]